MAIRYRFFAVTTRMGVARTEVRGSVDIPVIFLPCNGFGREGAEIVGVLLHGRGWTGLDHAKQIDAGRQIRFVQPERFLDAPTDEIADDSPTYLSAHAQTEPGVRKSILQHKKCEPLIRCKFAGSVDAFEVAPQAETLALAKALV